MKTVKFLLILFFSLSFICAHAKGKSENLTGEYFAIAEAYADLKKYDKAIEFYGKAAKDKSYYNSSKYNIARMYGLSNQWGKAADILKELYRSAETNEKIAIAYAYALSSSGELEKAMSVYGDIYAQNKESPSHAFNYVRILIASKKYEDASKLIKELKEKFTEDSEKKVIDSLEKTISNFTNPKKDKTSESGKKTAKGKEQKEESAEKDADTEKPAEKDKPVKKN